MKNDKIKKIHKESVEKGNTDAKEPQSDRHFVVFVNHNGEIYELDGAK